MNQSNCCPSVVFVLHVEQYNYFHIMYYRGWLGGIMVRALDFRSVGHRLDF